MKRNIQRASQTRVFSIEDRAGPSHNPVYQSLARATGIAWGQGDITPIRVPDPKQYGRYVVVDKIRGQQDLPGLSLEFRMTRDLSAILSLVRKGCPIDVQLHVGACKDPSDFDAGWEKIHVLEDADVSNYSTDDLGAFDADQEASVMETIELMASDYYEVGRLTFGQKAEAEIVQSVIDVAICDARTCGVCGLPSDGCQRIFAVQVPAGASPGLPPEVVYTQDGFVTAGESIITSMPANQSPSAMSCVGPYLAVVSNGDDSIHYALIVDILSDSESWTEITTGIVGAGSPNDLFSVSRTLTWIVGDGGYIYRTEDITAGVTAVLAGDLTSENLQTIHAFDDDNVLVGGENNAILLSRNGGITWTLVTGSVGQAAVNITAVWMLGENEWYAGYADGTLWYTIDSGTNWTQKALPGAITSIDDIQFATRTVGYIAGRAGVGATAGRLLRTISGGNTWYVLPEEAALTVPSAAQFHAIAACGDNPNLLVAGGDEVADGDGILVIGSA